MSRFSHILSMPNHIHSTIELIEAPGQKQISAFEVIRTYKALASHTIRKNVGDLWLGWQEGDWKAVILSEARLANARQYIHNNPAKWTQDRLMREEFKQYEIRRSHLYHSNNHKNP